MSEERLGVGRWLTEATLLAAIPAAGYLIAFVNQLGFCSSFAIPSVFVTLDLGNVLAATLPLAAWALLLAASLTGAAFWGRPPIRTVTALAVALPFIVWRKTEIWLPVGCVASLEGFEFVLRRYFPKHYAKPDPPSRTAWKAQWAVFLVYLVGVFVFVSYLSGSHEANTQVEFLVRPGTPEVAVLRMYGGRLITAPFDRKTKKLGNVLTVVPLESEVTLRREAVGPLHL